MDPAAAAECENAPVGNRYSRRVLRFAPPRGTIFGILVSEKKECLLPGVSAICRIQPKTFNGTEL